MSLHGLNPPDLKENFCPHLGVLDDAETCLAYPSAMNLCYRAKPVSVVSLGHQREICLSPVYARCPVFQREGGGPLPKQLRGARTARVSKKVLLIVLILLLALGLFAAWRTLPWFDFLSNLSSPTLEGVGLVPLQNALYPLRL